MYYINLKNGQQHTTPTDITSDNSAIQYAVDLFGRYQIVEIINENTGENIL